MKLNLTKNQSSNQSIDFGNNGEKISVGSFVQTVHENLKRRVQN
jgi:hypothetical protein